MKNEKIMTLTVLEALQVMRSTKIKNQSKKEILTTRSDHELQRLRRKLKNRHLSKKVSRTILFVPVLLQTPRPTLLKRTKKRKKIQQ